MSIWRNAMTLAREIMKPILSVKNSESAPFAGLVGHSHMDTAWLWELKETLKKCARTYSNQLSLMDQYPEYRFIQSSAYHSELIRRNYPKLFDQLKERIMEGRYEPNGAVWVECDCNITSGESMIRQFLWGQRYTQEHFNYTSNCFWLPDTFGYSAAIPQIMKGCGVDYFLTSKLSWNDTNRFPYETFLWEGIDGTAVLTHFNCINCWPDAKSLIEMLNEVQNKNTAKMRLVSYGWGDGGGGPQFEMIEMARRVKNLDGCPKSEHVNVGKFMERLENEMIDPPTFRGELYLEMHRGTLTNHHTIKRNNRKAEISLHNLEYFTVCKAIRDGVPAEDKQIKPLTETLLVNQFHDILPGTSIKKVHEQSKKDMAELMNKANALINDTIVAESDNDTLTILNTLGFERTEIVYVQNCNGKTPEDKSLMTQYIEDIHGNKQLCIANIKLPSFGGVQIKLVDSFVKSQSESSFIYKEDVLTTPFAKVTFDDNGTISSFIDTRINRQLRGSGYPLNSFLLGEDVSLENDNWDIDADFQLKFSSSARLIDRKFVSDGSIQFRIRSTYQLTKKSTITQDMIFYSYTPRIDFVTIIDWNERHKFLKVGFDTTILSSTARHEIQFGHSQKPTTRNNSLEQAMFEVTNHKYTDLSETGYGVAILNDCKYGVSVVGSDIRLSLHKGGCLPDVDGDIGIHECTYSFLPHLGGFSAKNTIHPAYAINVPPVVVCGRANTESFVRVNCDNIMIETIKPCEDNQNAFIIRIYEAEGTFTNAQIYFGMNCRNLELTNMLEETIETLGELQQVELAFKPFEIKTIKVKY